MLFQSCLKSPIGQASIISLANVLPSCVFDLDATKSQSYSGSGQIWSNINTAPADGSNKSAHDLWLGTDGNVQSSDPTFNGSAGAQSGYFSMDGGDYFRTPGNTGFVQRMHRTDTGNSFSLAICFRYISSAETQQLFSSRTSTSAPGISIFITSAGTIALGIRGDSANVTYTASSPVLVTNTDYVLVLTFSDTQWIWYLNGTPCTSATRTKNTCMTNASGTFMVGVSDNMSSNFMTNTTRIYACSGFLGALNSTEATALLKAYRARHNRAYA